MSIRNSQPQRCCLAAAIIVGLAMSATVMPASAQATTDAQATPTQDAQQTADTDDKKVKTLDMVEVTGSRIKRAQIEGPSPVVTITADDLRKQGFSTIAEALGTLTSNNGQSPIKQLSNNEAYLNQPGAEFLNLRGLGVGYQLILLNGKRMAAYAASSGAAMTGVSIGSIPMAAVERIEVLSGGASAIYGSDAVAGVVNIITKDRWDGNHLRLRGGDTSRGGSGTGNIQFSGGHGWDRGSVTYAFEQLNRKPIRSAQRSNVILTGMNAPGNAGSTRPTYGLDSALYDYSVDDYLWLNSSGSLVAGSDDTDGSALAYSCRSLGPSYFPMYGSSSDTSPYTCGNANYYDGDILSNKYNKTSAYVSGSYQFTDHIKGYGQFLVQHSREQSANRTSQYLYNAGDAYYNVGGGGVNQFEYWRALVPSDMGGTPIRTWNENLISAVAGARGTIADRFDWDASLSLSRDEMKSSWRQLLTNKVNSYLFGPAVGITGDGSPIYDLDYSRLFGLVTASDYAAMTDKIRNRNVSQTSQAQFVFSGPLFTLPAGDVEMAALAEAEHSTYRLNPDSRSVGTYSGADSTFNYTAITGGGARNRAGAGLELRVPLLDSLTLNTAGRYDKYNDISSIGGAFTWQAALEWRPRESLLVRASHHTSFMAPNIMWIYGDPITSYDDYAVDYYQCRVAGLDLTTTAGSSQCAANYHKGVYYSSGGNNRALHEETAASDGIGFVWDIADKLSLSVDWWSIHLKGKAEYLDATTILSNDANCLLGKTASGAAVDPHSAACKLYSSLVTRDTAGELTGYSLEAINRAGVRTKGYDASLKYAWRWDAVGNLSLNAGYSRTLSYDVKLAEGDPWVSYMKCSYSYYSCGDQPVAFRDRTNLTLSWNQGDWAASLYGYRNGARRNYQSTGWLQPYVAWNGSVSRKLTDKIRLSLDVDNLFDKYGPKDTTMTWYPFYQTIYGINGRSYYVNLDMDF